MRYPSSEKLEIIRLVEGSHLSARLTLAKLGISRTTFYRWYDRCLQRGEAGLQNPPPSQNTSGTASLTRGFVAQKGPWPRGPLPRTDLSYSNGSRYAESSIAVENCSTDLNLCDLSVEVTSHEALAQ